MPCNKELFTLATQLSRKIPVHWRNLTYQEMPSASSMITSTVTVRIPLLNPQGPNEACCWLAVIVTSSLHRSFYPARNGLKPTNKEVSNPQKGGFFYPRGVWTSRSCQTVAGTVATLSSSHEPLRQVPAKNLFSSCQNP